MIKAIIETELVLLQVLGQVYLVPKSVINVSLHVYLLNLLDNQ